MHLAASAVLALLPSAAAQDPAPPAAASGCVQVPLDHGQPSGPAAAITYELGAAFDHGKPTVLVVADAQQFHLRPGALAALQQDQFGDACNVVGIVRSRGTVDAFLAAARGADGQVDWTAAYRLFRSGQWVEDLEAVRVQLLGAGGQVSLYGASGGALLAAEYLQRHGDKVARAFLAAPVMPALVGECGLASDRFWKEIGAVPGLQPKLLGALAAHAGERRRVLLTLQRQNFFVAPAQLAAARGTLIEALAAGDEAAFGNARRDYQVEAIEGLLDGPLGAPIRVREFEFVQPCGELARLRPDECHPNIEVQREAAAPLLALAAAGRIEPLAAVWPGLHGLAAEVFVLAGRWDHTVDYRTAIAFAASIPHHCLFLADDDHMFARLGRDRADRRLQRAFLAHGLQSPELQAALAAAAPCRWREQ